MKAAIRRWAQVLLLVVAYGLVVAVVTAPVAAERAVEGVRFEDRLGSLPVEVSLSRNGFSTLDSGILGKLYWERTGAAGFGATIRATGPPEAGGTLTSYVSPRFVEANAQFISDPGSVAEVYGEELKSQLWQGFWSFALWTGLVGGVTLALVFRGRRPALPADWPRWHRWGIVLACLGVAMGLSVLTAQRLLAQWQGSAPIAATYPMPGFDDLSFSSPQTLEVARQVQPFIEKNSTRIRERRESYQDATEASLRAEIPAHLAGLEPREGERIVLAEADPQGSLVGTSVREELYALLGDQLGDDAIVMRTISGDVTSNGTVAEESFVEGEAHASPDVPTIAVKGDHDSEATVEQLEDNDVIVPDFDTVEIDDLRVVAANDPAFKTLFGGLVINDSGITESELGIQLREEVDQDEPIIVLLHQPRSVAGYLGISSTGELRAREGRETVPWDDGIPDAPPGSINVGHLHDADGPWVVWNTDGDLVTWTVVNQLGTAGGVEENPTINRFSTPFSTPLKAVSVQLQYVSTESGLQTGHASIAIATDGTVTVTDRVDLGLSGGVPVPIDEVDLAADPLTESP